MSNHVAVYFIISIHLFPIFCLDTHCTILNIGLDVNTSHRSTDCRCAATSLQSVDQYLYSQIHWLETKIRSQINMSLYLCNMQQQCWTTCLKNMSQYKCFKFSNIDNHRFFLVLNIWSLASKLSCYPVFTPHCFSFLWNFKLLRR